MTSLTNKRRLTLIGIDLAIFFAVYLMVCVLLSFTETVNLSFFGYVYNSIAVYICIFAARLVIGVYSNMWRYANAILSLKLILADLIGGGIAVAITVCIPPCNIGGWRTCALVSMACIMTLASRFVYQHAHRSQNIAHNKSAQDKIPVAIIGAGQIGSLLAEELLYDRNSRYSPMFFVDKDLNKVGVSLLGLRVYASDDKLVDRLRSYGVHEVFIAISDLNEEKLKGFYEFYTGLGCKVKIYDFPIKSDGDDKTEKKRAIRDVRIEDLLFRDTIKVTDGAAADYYRDKVVLITGGGGSIGSELCRQVAKCAPKKLVILDIYENNAYDIQQELIRKYGRELDLCVEIASVRDRTRLDAIFAHYRPQIVFHAAAHKHVPLMEHSNAEPIKNNVLGTYNTADMAEKHGAEKFILISTDKAVNPTNVMGASKRLCEMVIQCRRDSATAFAAVRFGNVLGSNGSVIPLFRRQIEAGGPVTVTDKRIIRYFMTIPEASGLVMQAGAMAKCGELFVLDMGKPIKIIDLAENMVKLSGLTPYEDIDIIETGLRPGEKLYEELLIKTEDLEKTENDLIFIERDTPFTRDEVDAKLAVLTSAVERYSDRIASPEITEAMKSVVSTFHSPEEVNVSASDSEEMKLASAT